MKRAGSIRPALDASGRQRADARGVPLWLLRYYDPAGKQRNTTRAFPTHDAAQAFIERARAAPADLGWSAIATAWARSEGPRLSASYLDHALHSADQIARRLGSVGPAEATLQQMADYLRWRSAETSPAAAKKDLAHALAICRWARSVGMLPAIPWEHVRRPRHRAEKRRATPLEALPALLSALDDWLRPITMWILLTGCRQQDAAGLLETDVTEDAARLRVKGGASVTYPLDDALRAVLRDARALKARHQLRSLFVFTNSAGGRWECTHLAHRIAEVWAPLGEWRLHNLRHRFGTEAGRRFGADMVQAGLAHKSRATSETYVHLHEDEHARAEVGRAVRAAILDALGGAEANKTSGKTQVLSGHETACAYMTGSETITVMIDGRKALIPIDVARNYLV